MTELCDFDAVELGRRIGTQENLPAELLESCIQRTEDVNGAVRGIIVSFYMCNSRG